MNIGVLLRSHLKLLSQFISIKVDNYVDKGIALKMVNVGPNVVYENVRFLVGVCRSWHEYFGTQL